MHFLCNSTLSFLRVNGIDTGRTKIPVEPPRTSAHKSSCIHLCEINLGPAQSFLTGATLSSALVISGITQDFARYFLSNSKAKHSTVYILIIVPRLTHRRMERIALTAPIPLFATRICCGEQGIGGHSSVVDHNRAIQYNATAGKRANVSRPVVG